MIWLMLVPLRGNNMLAAQLPARRGFHSRQRPEGERTEEELWEGERTEEEIASWLQKLNGGHEGRGSMILLIIGKQLHCGVGVSQPGVMAGGSRSIVLSCPAGSCSQKPRKRGVLQPARAGAAQSNIRIEWAVNGEKGWDG